MARSVTFNGITQFRPGGITRVNANALVQTTSGINSIIGLIGEADGGEPDVLTIIDDPALAKTTFRSGPLADAIVAAFDFSDDPRVPGGASRVLAIKTNQSTQSTKVMYNKVAADTAAAGSTDTVVNLTTGGLTVDAQIGNQLRVTFAASSAVETRTITDNAAGTITVSPAFSAAPAAADVLVILAPMVTVTTKDYGVHTGSTSLEYEPGVAIGQASTVTFEGDVQTSADVGGKSFLNLEYVGQAAQTVDASGTADGAGSSTTVVNSGASFGTYTNRYVYVSGGALAQPNLRKISTNTGTILTVGNAFVSAAAPTAPGVGAAYSVRRGKIYEGTAAAASGSSLTLPATLEVALNELAGMVVVITSGAGIGQRRSIASNTAGLSGVLTLDYAWSIAPGAATFAVRNITTATATVAGAAGVAAGLTSSEVKDGASPATGLNVTFTSTMTITDLVNTINTNTDYLAAVPPGINGNNLVSKFDFDLGATAVDLRNDLTAVTTQPTPTALPSSTWPNRFKCDLQQLIDNLNNSSEFVSAVRAVGSSFKAGAGRPEFTGGAVGVPGDTVLTLAGGTRGASANSNWQDAFDTLLGERCVSVVPLISADLSSPSTATFAAVAAQLANHLSQANGVYKSERGGYIGMNGTKTQMIALANSLGNADIQVTGQKLKVLDANSNLTLQDAWISAVAAASMRAGMAEVGEPLTFKYIRTSDLQQDVSWDPSSRTDANQFIQSGILFAEFIRGKGTRWVRDLTTYVIDDNLAYMEGSVRDVVRYVSYKLRTRLEDEFTGRKATPATATSIKDVASKELEQMRSDNIIVDSVDSAGAFVKAYHNLRVTISGDTATLRVAVFPVPGINFELNDIYLELPTQSA
jgi:hypothetical protein